MITDHLFSFFAYFNKSIMFVYEYWRRRLYSKGTLRTFRLGVLLAEVSTKCLQKYFKSLAIKIGLSLSVTLTMLDFDDKLNILS